MVGERGGEGTGVQVAEKHDRIEIDAVIEQGGELELLLPIDVVSEVGVDNVELGAFHVVHRVQGSLGA